MEELQFFVAEQGEDVLLNQPVEILDGVEIVPDLANLRERDSDFSPTSSEALEERFLGGQEQAPVPEIEVPALEKQQSLFCLIVKALAVCFILLLL